MQRKHIQDFKSTIWCTVICSELKFSFVWRFDSYKIGGHLMVFPTTCARAGQLRRPSLANLHARTRRARGGWKRPLNYNCPKQHTQLCAVCTIARADIQVHSVHVICSEILFYTFHIAEHNFSQIVDDIYRCNTYNVDIYIVAGNSGRCLHCTY